MSPRGVESGKQKDHAIAPGLTRRFWAFFRVDRGSMPQCNTLTAPPWHDWQRCILGTPPVFRAAAQQFHTFRQSHRAKVRP